MGYRRVSRRRTKTRRVVIRAKQLALPAGFHERSGRPATLEDVVSTRIPTLDGSRLTGDQRNALALLRIRKQRRLRLTSSHGVIDKKRAMEEVRQGTALGQALVEIEHIAIDLLREEAERRRAARRKKRV